MSTVLILQENARINYNPATKFGMLKFVTNKEFIGNSGSITDKQILNDLQACVNDYNFDEDYVVLSGSPILIGLAVYALSMKLIKSNADIDGLHCLHYDKIRNRYNEVIIETETLMKTLTEIE